jgi:hypothetical protein
MDVSLTRRPATHEVCILPAGAKRGIFFPVEVLEWLQAEAISWTIPDETDRTLFKLRFAHLRA